MEIGLRLEGRCAHDDALLSRASAWLARREDDPTPRVTLEDGLLVAELHPAAEPMLIDAPAPGRVRLAANTATAGPGYHRHVATLALALGEALGIEWELEGDSTGWIARRDDDALERTFLDGIRELAEAVLALAKDGKRGFGLLLPAGHAFEHDGFVLSALGPRDEAWVRAAAEDPREGTDLFAFWGAAGDARYYLDLARVHMWLDVRWRAPLDDAERAMLERVATWVERAHGLDPEADIPWAEHSELFTLLGEESLRATRAHLKARASSDRAPIGYRRRAVRVTLSGGFSIRIPGELAERWDERGTWVAWDARRSVWFTSMTVHGEDGRPSPSTEATLASMPPLESEELLELERGELRGVACFVVDEHEGERVLRLEAHAARGANAAIGTIVFTRDEDHDWALATWGSLVHG